MDYTLENQYLTLTFRSQGGELTSIKSKKDGLEYLWKGDPEYWSYHSPVLFPTIGKVINNEYRHEGKTYPLKQHGFARLMDFEGESSDDSMSFTLKYSEETLKIYPFKFALTLTYTLKGNKIRVDYKVENLDEGTIHFSIGGHPAFMCPLFPEEALEDYSIVFNKSEDIELIPITPEGFFKRKKQHFGTDMDYIPLRLELFQEDALVFSKLKSSTIAIKSWDHDRSVTMDFSEFPYLGVWTKKEGAPFICLEPWQGHGDYEDFTGELKDKEGSIALEKGNTFTIGYTLTIN
ncbi:aldose 1-epimerase family protein [Alloiococcus sp. CFN-8]|uniref:aldose 1-epimerase family protein n=1 Tax=Alloiococcus sp. CFN-8 TaxID=3416081 RepID=UPI003CEB71CA